VITTERDARQKSLFSFDKFVTGRRGPVVIVVT
jgi:hypothetical protein